MRDMRKAFQSPNGARVFLTDDIVKDINDNDGFNHLMV